MGWRGAERNGIIPWLPDTLPTAPAVVWRQALTGEALAGVAATAELAILADRDASDADDIYRCLRVADGSEVWQLRCRATGRLDYGNAPRATPLIVGDLVYLYNAFGLLHCVKLATGEVVWKKDLWQEYQGRDSRNAWGASSSPLLVDGRLIVNPGGPRASLVALDPASAKPIWSAPGAHAAFSSWIDATLGGRRQLIGYDDKSLRAYDPNTGEPLWSLVPPEKGDFNVPTPIPWEGKLLVCTENNGTRLYAFDDQGKIQPEPVAVNDELAPDTHTPIILGQRVWGVWSGLHCLDLSRQLASLWSQQEQAFDDYTTIVGSGDRVLVVTQHGELILLDATANHFMPLARWQVLEDDPGVYSHPAFVGTKMLLRGSREVVCLELFAE